MLTDIQSNAASAGTLSSVPVPTSGAPRLKVLHVVSHLGLGGTENGVLKVIAGLGSLDFEHSLCAVRKIDESFASRLDSRTPVFTAGSARPGFQFPLFRLARIMRKVHPHIVHTRNFGALEAVAAARLAHVPLVIHSEHGYEIEILSGLPLRRRLLCSALYRMSDGLFTVTRDLRSYHSGQSWLDIERFRVLPNGVDIEKFSPRSHRAAELRSALGIPASRLVIGSVGRFVPIKDYGTLLRAAAILAGRGMDIHVLLVGKGPESQKLRAQVAGTPELAGRVSFPGATDRAADSFNAMDIFVLPSISEGMSNTMIEAMASGLPVAATCVGGNREVMGAEPDGGFFRPGDFHGLAEVLAPYVNDSNLRRSAGAAARRRAVEQFSLTGMIERYRELYLELALRQGIWKGR